MKRGAGDLLSMGARKSWESHEGYIGALVIGQEERFRGLVSWGGKVRGSP
jgi:hypothetical protein